MKIILKRGALLPLICVIAILFGFTITKVDSKFKAIHISWVFQMLTDGELIPQRQSIDVFYSKDYLIARKRAFNFDIFTKLRPGTNEVVDEKTTRDSSFIYYISKRGEKFGLAFNSFCNPPFFRTGLGGENSNLYIIFHPSAWSQLRRG